MFKNYIRFYTTRNNVELHHKYYIINYHYNFQDYKIFIPRVRGPTSIIQILDEQDIDITKELLPFLGPHNNFHGQNVTPQMMNRKMLKVCYLNGSIKTFDTNDIISQL